MFPPGYFTAHYFAPGYWPDATEATASDAMAATLAGAAQLAGFGRAAGRITAGIAAGASLVASGVADGGETIAPPALVPVGGGYRPARRLVLPPQILRPAPVYAQGAAVIQGGASVVAGLSGSTRGQALCAGAGQMAGAAVARANFIERDNEFWLLAA